MLERLERLPVPVLPTLVGALTLSNVYAGFGYSWVRHLSMWAAAFIMVLYVIKLVKYYPTCAKEYNTTVPASLYAGFNMVTMILGSYIYEYVPSVGRTIVIAATLVHACHILLFTYKNVIKERNINTFMPSWFVTYNGILVSCVVGGGMGIGFLKYIVWYGIAIYFIIIPIMIWRLMKVEVKPAVYHTMAVVLAPCSLCLVGYFNVIENKSAVIAYILYACVLASFAFIVIKLPKFFAFSFTPGFAGLTFPMAIGIVASNKMAGFLTSLGQEAFAGVVTQIAGIQVYLTTFIVGYVVINFIIMALKIERK